MLGKELRKKLQKHSWEYIIKNDSNPWQTWHRLRSSVNTELNDFVLLANKLPEEKQAEIFSSKKIDKLVQALLLNGSYNKSDIRKANIADAFVNRGINHFISQYRDIETDSALNKIATDKLIGAWVLCQSIRSKIGEKSIGKATTIICSNCGKKIN